MRSRTTVLKVALLACSLVLGACRCGNDVNMVETRFRVAPETETEGLDLGEHDERGYIL